MSKNEIIQWTIVSVIVLVAIIWVVVRLILLSRKKGSGGCSCCSQESSCKLKELKQTAKDKKCDN